MSKVNLLKFDKQGVELHEERMTIGCHNMSYFELFHLLVPSFLKINILTEKDILHNTHESIALRVVVTQHEASPSNTVWTTFQYRLCTVLFFNLVYLIFTQLIQIFCYQYFEILLNHERRLTYWGAFLEISKKILKLLDSSLYLGTMLRISNENGS